jgi:hypothetical protein
MARIKFSAAYIPSANKILGCRRGSATWWHEVGHMDLEAKTGLQSKWLAVKEELFLIMIIAAFLQRLDFFLVGFIIYILPRGFFELYAWVFAFKNRAGWI